MTGLYFHMSVICQSHCRITDSKNHSTRRKERECETRFQMEEETTNQFLEGKFHVENPFDMLESICQTWSQNQNGLPTPLKAVPCNNFQKRVLYCLYLSCMSYSAKYTVWTLPKSFRCKVWLPLTLFKAMYSSYFTFPFHMWHYCKDIKKWSPNG